MKEIITYTICFIITLSTFIYAYKVLGFEDCVILILSVITTMIFWNFKFKENKPEDGRGNKTI